MPSIKYKKKTYAGATFPVLEMTKAEYDALPEAKKMDGTVYMITDDTGGWEAENASYDNTQSGLTAVNVQDALDEIVSDVSGCVVNNGSGYGQVYNDRISNATLRWYRINGSLVYIWAVFRVASDLGTNSAIATGFPQPAHTTTPKIHSAGGVEVYINQNGSMVLATAAAKDAWLTVSGWYLAN